MNLVTYSQILFCPETNFKCKLRTQDLLTADYVDADWDSISGALTFKAYWSSARGDEGWKETHFLQKGIKEGGKGSLEIGVLMNEVTAKGEDEELKYSGFLTQVGRDDHACKPFCPCFFKHQIGMTELTYLSNSTGAFLLSRSTSSSFTSEQWLQRPVPPTNRPSSNAGHYD
jgi:hypothetical protein